MKIVRRAARKQRPRGLVPRPEGECGVHQSRDRVSSERRWGHEAIWGSRAPAVMVLIGPRDDRGRDSWACGLLLLITLCCCCCVVKRTGAGSWFGMLRSWGKTWRVATQQRRGGGNCERPSEVVHSRQSQKCRVHQKKWRRQRGHLRHASWQQLHVAVGGA